MAGLPILKTSPPHTFRIKIESFSSLSSSPQQRFESCEFDDGGYKWKLALYPNGNRSRDGKDHLSLYLVSLDSNYFTHDKEILVSFGLFMVDQLRNKPLVVQVVSKFQAMKCQAGLDKFLSLKVLNNPSNGYLVNDACFFGAEVFQIEEKTTTLNKIIKQVPFKHAWKITKFSKMRDMANYSEIFRFGGHAFKMQLYPKGISDGRGNSLSLYLALADPQKLSMGTEVPVEFTLRVIDQVNGKHREFAYTVCLSKSTESWGHHSFLPLRDLNCSSGYLVGDTCLLEAELKIPESAKTGD